MSDIILAVWLAFSATVLVLFLVFFVKSQNNYYTKLHEIEKRLEVVRKTLAEIEHKQA